MHENKAYAHIILYENSIFVAVAASKQMLNTCSQKCQKGVKNGPNYNFQVKVCSSACRIRAYTKLIATLTALKGGAVSEGILNKKIAYFTQQLQQENLKYKAYRKQLTTRQTTVPVDMSLKPSPERWNPKKLN